MMCRKSVSKAHVSAFSWNVIFKQKSDIKSKTTV